MGKGKGMGKGTEKHLIKNWLAGLCLILLIKTAILGWIISTGYIGLAPDEAQYWTWSQELDWGYYSKPPGIAWQIWLGTLIFGNSEFGIRSTALVIGFLLSIAIFKLAQACKLKPTTCFWAGFIFALSPMGVLASFLAITDGGMILFWTLTCIYLVMNLERGTAPNYRIVGLLILFGALFKWPIFVLWIFIIIFGWLFSPLLKKSGTGTGTGTGKEITAGFFISILGLFPSIVWNFSHDWVTFRHVFWTLSGRHGQEVGTTPLMQGNFWEFLGAQAILLSPIPFFFLLAAFMFLIRKRKEIRPSLFFCGTVTSSILITYSLLALFQKMQGNWAVFAYPTGIVFLSWYACEKVWWGKKALFVGILLSLLLIITAFSIPFIQSRNFFTQHPIPYKFNPFKHNLGWSQLGRELKALGYNAEEDFLFGDRYQISSILSFYGEGQHRAYFLNLSAIRKNQFSFWPSMAEEQKGKNGFFVVVENTPHLEKNAAILQQKYEGLLKNYFDQVRLLGIKPLFIANGKMVKGAFIFEGTKYNGSIPSDPELY